RLVRPLLEPLGDLAVLLSGLRDAGSGLLDLLHGGRDLRQAARGPARHVLDPPHLRRARRHRGRDVFDLVPDRVRGVGDVLGAAATSPRCRFATVRICSPSDATRSAASAISAVACRRRSRPAATASSSPRWSWAPLDMSTMAVATSLAEAASCSLIAERSAAEAAIRS